MSLLGLAGRLAQPFLMATDPEMGHHLAVQALKVMPIPSCGSDDPVLRVSAFGMDFPNPVGMAAGFDKQAEVPDAVLRLGFGHVEVGGVTPLPQPGNPRPRVFRLVADEGIINRYGLNSDGMEAVTARLAARRGRGGIVGVNFGPNKETKDRIADYAAMASLFAPVVDYLSVNVSSPNTPGLRDLQQVAALDEIVARVTEASKAASPSRHVPILVKIAPDLALADLDDLVAMALKRGIDGMIVSNTTISRPSTLRDQTRAKEAGGLSGKPVFDLSTRMLAETYRRVEGRFPLVGVGGVNSAETAFTKIVAGASLIQLYSALIYKGLGLVDDIKAGLAKRLKQEGMTSVAQAVGRNADAWRLNV